MFAKKKTVASVMKSFYTAVEDLAGVAKDNRERVAVLQDEIIARSVQRDECSEEADLADRVAAKLRAVIEG